jgi:TatD DNase family protein
MTAYIDIHTHKPCLNPSEISIKNILLHDLEQFKPEKHCQYSIGWHPWYINNTDTNTIKGRIETFSGDESILAIGECGIDRAIDTPVELQKEVFALHILSAEKNKKPLIIHSVKAYSDILETLNQKNYKGTLILHGYKGNIQQEQQFSKYNTFFSFGAALFNNEKTISTFIRTPIENIFFETDEEDISIEKIYLRAAEIKHIPVDVLKKQIKTNYDNIFKK